ncbi:hypothetical protein M948_16760 [Virgibacillus sp. CM-4]|uniref:DUF5081 family protein n=1 Tax=Virgibacillus sp. CM-4 TaxID=1354277 RepID=UPI000388754E|nr:DUF5081 family protein [Virgibacillus sp. CM-4]EQB36683.1 hypothetical protein M948_16760 [Virgibacillus sp. CM-4]
MNDSSTDTFHVSELFLLAASFGGHVLFGLPEKKIFQLKGEEVFADAQKRLLNKEILSADGKVTNRGAMIIQALEHYYLSEKYVRINNLMFAFHNEYKDELLILVEVEEKNLYKLVVASKAIVLQMLTEKFELLTREPDETEQSFLKKELSHQERRETEELEPGYELINMEFFHLDERRQEVNNAKYYQQWLIFTKDEKQKLIMVDTVRRKYYHASQYWFLKLLFDEMEFPYKEAK